MRIFPGPTGPSRGYQAIELLAVFGIVAVMLALFVPALNHGRESARQLQCLNNLKQIGLGMHIYHSSYERFPMGFVARAGRDPLRTNPGWGWPASMLGQMEQAMIARMIDFRDPITSPRFGTVWATNLNVLHCPGDRVFDPFEIKDDAGKAITVVASGSYAGCYGALGDVANDPGGGNGFFVRNKTRMMEEFPDGLGQTFAIGERSSMLTRAPWIGVVDRGVCTINPAGPSRSREIGRGAVQVLAHIGEKPLNSLDSDPDDFFSMHPGGVQFLMGDGSARFVRDTISPAILRAHATRSGGEIIGDEDR